MNIVVTGSNGFIGMHVVETLCKKGYYIIGIDRLFPTRKSDAYTWIRTDLSQSNISPILEENKVDIVVHCAAVVPKSFEGIDAKEAGRLNTIIDRNLISACAIKQVRLVYFSSMSVYGLADKLCTEDSDLRPENPYSIAKAKSETEIASSLKDFVILRISAPYGKGSKIKTVLYTFIERALSNQNLYYYGSGKRQQDFIAAEDVANSVPAAISYKGDSSVFNIASGEPISMFHLAQLVIEAIPQTTSSILASGKPDPQEEYKAQYDINKAQTKLHWEPTISLKEGIRQLADALKGNQ